MQSTVFLEKISKLKIEDLDQIKGLGPILAKNLVDFTASDRFNHLFEKLKALENNSVIIEISSSGKTISDGILSGQNICITGSFETPRNEIKDYFISLGAKITDNVTKKTTILLVGNDPGSKLDKASELGIKVFESVEDLEIAFG